MANIFSLIILNLDILGVADFMSPKEFGMGNRFNQTTRLDDNVISNNNNVATQIYIQCQHHHSGVVICSLLTYLHFGRYALLTDLHCY